jgi:hypothetical protein
MKMPLNFFPNPNQILVLLAECGTFPDLKENIVHTPDPLPL